MAGRRRWIFMICMSSCLFPSAVVASYRGGAIHWRPLNRTNSPNGTVEISHRIAWRRNSSQGGTCSDDTIANDDLLGSGELMCRSGCSGTVGSMSYLCTDFSVTDNWSAGERTYEHDFGSSLYFEASYADSGFITFIGLTVGWELRVKGNLTRRSDNGLINTSPVSSMLPIIHLQSGCEHIIRIPVEDVDGDLVKCRSAQSSYGECSQVCLRLLPASLNESTCELHYTSTDGSGIYSVALQIEDFASAADTIPLSSIPLQFVASVFPSEYQCTDRPRFIAPTRLDGSCVGVSFNTQWQEQIVVQSFSEDIVVTEIVTSSPQGLRKSVLLTLSDGDGISKSYYYVNLTWKPTEIQYGPNIMCFSALTNVGLVAPQRCITLLGGVEAPEPLTDSVTPTGVLHSNPLDFSITFNRFFVRPSRNRFIRIFEEGVGEIFSINVANSTDVVYPTDGTMLLKFQVDLELSQGSVYSVLLDPGVAVGTEYCNAESPAITDHSVWKFTIERPECFTEFGLSLTNRTVTRTGTHLEHEGNLEICFEGKFVAICDESWDDTHAQISCNRLGYPAPRFRGEAVHNLKSTVPIVLESIVCNDTVSMFSRCSVQTPPSTSRCLSDATDNAAGIRCIFVVCIDGAVRLIDGFARNKGRVEVCHNNDWGTVCNRLWDDVDAGVVCRQLGFSFTGARALRFPSFRAVPAYLLDGVACFGREESIFNCIHSGIGVHNCDRLREAGVECKDCVDGELRLIGGSKTKFNDGRVEVCMNRIWGTVCDRTFDVADAEVACNQLGHSELVHAEVVGDAFFGSGSGPIFDLDCTANGTSNLCSGRPVNGTLGCTHANDAGIICRVCTDGDVRLVGGSIHTEGRVEVCSVNEWGKVCSRFWKDCDAGVVCRQAGFTREGAIAVTNYAQFGFTTGRVLVSSVRCFGDEDRIFNCPHRGVSIHNICGVDNVGVICANCSDGEFSLVGGNTSNEGRVEICMDNTWGTVCDKLFDVNDAEVVCKKLGYSELDDFHITSGGFFGSGSGIIFDIDCIKNSTNCSHQVVDGTSGCTHSNDVGIVCTVCSNGDVRLVGGAVLNRGRVEVCYSSRWTYICDDVYWSSSAAEVVCRQAGFSRSGAMDSGFTLQGPGTGLTLLAEVRCSGTEDRIFDCSHKGFGFLHTCYSEFATVSCRHCAKGEVSLIGGNQTNEGRVEICKDMVWGTVCDNLFDLNDAELVCAQLGYPELAQVIIMNGSFYGSGSGPIFNLECTETDGNFTNCTLSEDTLTCTHSNDVGIVCIVCFESSIRLVGGSVSTEGRIEVCRDNGWGTICDAGWDDTSAGVVCKELGFSQSDAIARGGAFFGHGTGSILFRGVGCSGYEASILDCYQAGVIGCNHERDAGVTCRRCKDGEITLAGKPRSKLNEGRLEICSNGTWGTVCDKSFGTDEAAIVCSQLGYANIDAVIMKGSFYNSGSGPIFNIECPEDGRSTNECSFVVANNSLDCTHSNDVGVVCQVCIDGDVRLADGSVPTEGRVEVCYSETWGTVCDTMWDNFDAAVVCRQLGLTVSVSTALSDAYFGLVNKRHFLDDVDCVGDETYLFDCSHAGILVHNCGGLHNLKDAGVICRNCTHGEVRLVGGSKPQEGRVEICIDQAWATICDRYFEVNDAEILCSQLGYSKLDPVIVDSEVYGFWAGLILDIECAGDGESVDNCIYKAISNVSTCTHSNDVGLICRVCTDDEIRLIGGSVSSEGRVEVCYNDEWGTICDERWTATDAAVACKRAGFSPLDAIALGRGIFGRGSGRIWLDDVDCLGFEDSLQECANGGIDNHDCNHLRDIGVRCNNCTDGSIILVGGNKPNEGRVEICVNGSWGTVCDSSFDLHDAEAACKRIGYSQLAQVNILGGASFGSGRGLILDFDCSQTGEAQNCTINSVNSSSGCTHLHDVGVVCIVCFSGDVRLADGPVPYEGRVEVCHDNKWGRVCDDQFDDLDAKVVCRQIGYPQTVAFAQNDAFYGTGSGQVFLDDLACTGNETRLINCTHRGIGDYHCGYRHIAGVICELCTNGEVRLVGGPNATIGRVEVCVGGNWGTICNGLWSDADAMVICTQLGLTVQDAVAIHEFNALYGDSVRVRPIFFNNVKCSGMETNILECVRDSETANCSNANEAGVQCIVCFDGGIRLVGGSSEIEGRVELCHNQQWGTICDNGWTDTEASVVCRQAGFSGFGSVALSRAAFGQSVGAILLDTVSCFGREDSILDCSHGGIGRHKCGHSEDAGVICEYCIDGELRLVGGATFTSGRVEVCINRIWGTVCDDLLDSRVAAVICEQLGFTRYDAVGISSAIYGPGNGPVHFSGLQCTGFEINILDCRYDQSVSWSCNHTNDAGVQCRLPDNIPPTILSHSAPSFSNENVTINWVYSEEATSFCTLRSPTSLTPVPCNGNSVTLTNLQEGYHTLYVQGTDPFNNTADPVRFTWRVDLIPPSIKLTSHPPAVSRQIEWLFRFQCTGERSCTFMCSIHNINDLAQFTDCSEGQLLATNLQNNIQYELSVTALDAVGNVGLIHYQWKIDTESPTLSVLSDITLSCEDNFSPNVTGIPIALDNEDSDPTVTHIDIPAEMCSIRRVWNATDNAGNNGTFFQTITFTNPQPPRILSPSEIAIPCGSIEEAFETAEQANLTITHPCNRPLTVTFSDSVPIEQCGFTFTRTWIVQDDCGTSTDFQQTVRVLDQQFPDSPANGQVNVELNEPLIWPQFPGAIRYQVYLWMFGTERPQEPLIVVNARKYIPPENYPSGTRLLWQIEYVDVENAITSSPVWGFETQPLPDLAVISVQIPPIAFTGRGMVVSWTVLNIGNRSTSASTWRDYVYFERSPTFTGRQRVASIRQRRFVDPQDGYISQATFTVGQSDVGTFYIFVIADANHRVNDVDRTNNVKDAITPVQISLTPPPNLVVEEVITPTSTFSGEDVFVRWTVKNSGTGITARDAWSDRVFLSKDEQLSSRGTRVLGTFSRRGFVGAGMSYSRREKVSIPRAIFGNYSIVVVTDVFNYVYEHLDEDDNSRAALPPLQIILSPPPDLIISSLQVGDFFKSGDVITIMYTVENAGAGEPFENYWLDELALVDPISKQIHRLGRLYHYGTLQPGSMYSNAITYVVPSSLSNGTYNLTGHTDYTNRVFEFDRDHNNIVWHEISIEERLSDLVVSTFSTSFDSTPQGNIICVNYTVLNQGTGPTLGSWVDRVGISFQSQFNPRATTFLRQFLHTRGLAPKEVISQMLTINIPRLFTGSIYVHIQLDFNGRIAEQSEINNVRTDGPINLPPVFPDLELKNFSLNVSNTVAAGDTIAVHWMVVNIGTAQVSGRWLDAISLEEATQGNSMSRTFKLFQKQQTRTLLSSDNYEQSVDVSIPIELSGQYNLVISVNDDKAIYESSAFSNNFGRVSLFLTTPPTPDLKVNQVKFTYFDTDRILSVEWVVMNAGNTMKETLTWADQIHIHVSSVFDHELAIELGEVDVMVGLLESQSEYVLSKSFVLPTNIEGDYYVFVETDSRNDVMEVNGENNNMRKSNTMVSIFRSSIPSLAIKVNDSILPTFAHAGEQLQIDYEVTNFGDSTLRLTSWIDGIYLIPSNLVDRNEAITNGILLTQVLNNHELKEGDKYFTSVSVSVPYGVNQPLFLAIVIDVNNKLEIFTGDVDERYLLEFSQSPIFIEQGPLPDLIPIAVNISQVLVGGQPVSVRYVVSNAGKNRALGMWFEAIFLSEDAFLDPFDVRLKTVQNLMELNAEQSYEQSVEVFIPFDIPSGQYYLFYMVDGANRIAELSVSNNIAQQIVTIIETITTDLSVTNVSADPTRLNYGDTVTFHWNLRNIGTLPASAYKCDTVYLSEDDIWDVGDLQLGSAQCGMIEIQPYEGDQLNDLSVQQSLLTPFVAQHNYTGIVRTRSNIRDPSLDNNIGIADIPLSISAPSLILGVPAIINLTPGDEMVYRIDRVPSEETLIATLTTTETVAFHDLFLRYRNPPTGFNFDAISKISLSYDQRATVRHTRPGTYYLRVKSNGRGSSPYQVEVTVKIAQFEILATAPEMGASLGNITIQFSGTVFGYNIRGELMHEKSRKMYRAMRTYWFSSEDVYATFDGTKLPEGMYSPRLQNLDTGSVSEMKSSFCIREGIPGRMTVDINTPGSLRAGDSARVPIVIRNTGNTDINIPTLVLGTGNGSSIVSMPDRPITVRRPPTPDPSQPPTPDPQPPDPEPVQQEERIPMPPNGPGGMLPPKREAKDDTVIKPYRIRGGRDKFDVCDSGNSKSKHPYADQRDDLQPPDVPEGTFDMVWDNFMESVGPSWDTLNQRMSEVATEMSLAHQRMPCNTRDLVDFQLRIADGLLSGTGGHISVFDMRDDNNNDFVYLSMRRRYSPYILKRRTSGPMGMGWILPHWEIRLKDISHSSVFLSRDRTITEFTTNDDSGVYFSVGGDAMRRVDGGFLYEDTDINEIYTFSNETGKLVCINSSLDDSSIAVEYADQDKQYPSSFKHSGGKSMTISYTDRDMIDAVDMLDENGNIEQTSFYGYDSAERCLTSVTVADSTATLSYNDGGDLVEMAYSSGNRRTFQYNEYNHLVGYKSFSSMGEMVLGVSMVPNWNGNVMMSIKPSNKEIEIKYNSNGEIVFVRENGSLPLILAQTPSKKSLLWGDKELSTEVFDDTTNTLHLTDANGNEIAYQYGNDQELRSITDSSGYMYNVEYDDIGRLIGFLNPDGNRTTVTYDSENNFSGIQNPDGSSIIYLFDSNFQLIQKDVGGEKSSYEYDSMRRSHLTKGSNKEGSVELKYDNAGRTIEISYPNGHTLTFGYNSLNQRTYIADGSVYNVSYYYDGYNRLSEIRQSNSDELIARYEFSDTNNILRKTLGNGGYSTYRYAGPVGQLSEIHNFLPGGEESSFFIYDYDNQGRMISLTTKNGNWTYRYDPGNQLVKWITPDGDVVEYIYDVRGNRLVELRNEQEEAYSANIVNQYLRFGDREQFKYDANGHLRQKISGGRRERYTFSADGKLTETETPNKRCSYRYDAFGNLCTKNCSDSSMFEYLVDPNGRYGAEIIAEISANGTVYFVGSYDQGLVAALNSVTKSLLFYEFDGIGYADNAELSVVSVVDDDMIHNTYQYDPFGRIIQEIEQCRNIHKFSGLRGIIADDELQNIYMMRSRHYDARHGRFLSMDPIGLSGMNPNLYVFAYNSPLNFGDPTGQIPLVVIAPYVISAVTNAALNAAAYAAVQKATGQERTTGGYIGAAVSGAISGLALPGAGIVATITANVAGSFAGQVVADTIDDKKVDYGAAAIGAAVGSAFGLGVPKKLFSHAAASKIGKKVAASYTKSVKPLIERLAKQYDIDPNIIKKLVDNKLFRENIPPTFSTTELVKLRNYLRWVLSRDPNDIVGPEGYGDAHFVPPDLVFEYTIRFENDPNATAPAQRVFIRHKLDDDLDERTFRVGTFGFGDFIRELPFMRAFVQEAVNTTESHGVFVTVTAGIDIVHREATWEFQALDPETGEPPVDPTVGFLPPNNGTSGQGFVTFSVRADNEVRSLSQIDAEATIIFDQNDPIDTPPIFNTIDGTSPTLNLTINQALLDTGIVALQLGKSDLGSGVASVDVYELIDNTEGTTVQPIQAEVADSVVILALSPGSQHRVFASAVDNVGNRQSMAEDLMNIIVVDVPLFEGLCPNNCSLRGNCSSFGICTCETGYFGSDCSLESPPMEPPILQLSSAGGMEGMPVFLTVSADVAGDNNMTIRAGLIIHISQFPQGSSFNKGVFDGTSWKLNSTEFGELELYLPEFFSGNIALSIIASYNQVSREGTLAFVVEAVANPPKLVIGETCYELGHGSFNIAINSSLADQDGSESLRLVIADLPDTAFIAVGQRKENGEYVVPAREFQEVSIELTKNFEPFNVTVSAYSVEEMNYDIAFTNTSLLIDFCDITDMDECEAGTHNCSQVCVDTVGSFSCNCFPGYKLSEDGYSCYEIVAPDECELGMHNCTQVCVNTKESYICACNAGFIIDDDERNCNDVDECQTGEDICDQICINIVGSYSCNCSLGFQLDSNGYSCKNVDECAAGADDCSQVCLDTIGSFECDCLDGYQLSKDGHTCHDMDECATGTHNCSQICVNTLGSYVCNCSRGFQLDTDGQTCNNVDECASGAHNCSQVCTDTMGSFKCDCLLGYETYKDGYSCFDVDECQTGTDICEQICVNTMGSYSCNCSLGFQLDSNGRTCSDVDECAISADNCIQVCVNSIGSFECDCFTGYQLTEDGYSCPDVDKCKAGLHNYHTIICISMNGSYKCGCCPGYEDIDECMLGTHDCQQICKNVNGSYVCDCLTDYMLHSDGHSCIPTFTLNFVNGSPKVKGNEVSVDFKSSRPLVSAICFLGRNIVKECLNGSVKFTEVPMGEFYVVRVEAWDSTFTRVVLRQQIVVFDTSFSLMFINDSPRINGNNVSVEFITSTPVSSATCYLGRRIFKDCASGKVVFTDIAAASYIFRVVAKRPGARIVQRRVLHILGKDSQSCSVHMINEGLRISGRNASIHFTGTGPVESYFCRMDDSDFFRCDSPITYFNLQDGTHTVRIKPQRCGEGDRRLSVKFKVESS